VMTEKYITLFQNIEVWNDFKRTCIPALTPAAGKSEIPARLLYGTTERQTNPNTPSNPPRNWNDPNNDCTTP
jgi:Starch-binding associating with outer membrane